YTFFKPEADSKGIKLKSSCYLPEDKAFLRTDREKLLSILTNLVKNAIKYTESGVIEIGYSNKTNSFEFYVKDTGIGIKEERQQAVFERFVQAEIDDKMAKQGAGLGLTISKAYVEKLGGKIWLESTIGVGSIFYFSIPDSSSKRILDSKLIVDTNHADYKFENLTVMIADDDNFSERHLTLVLKSWNCDVIIAKNGIEAINLYKSHPEIKIIMMDIKMPVMDGLTATREIRKIDNGIVIIAVTAYAMSSDVENAINAGCNEHVAKPIVRKDLLAKLIKYSR
ncbi:MAG TPA: ATP-binding protein, partial [Bacteroidales bacterium]|nr:ATP-binding protein [Bacteroidales bacterium]